MTHPFSRLLSLLALALLWTGCQAPQAFPTPTAAWQTHTGQAHYSGSRSVVGEVVVRRSGADEFQLSFASGPGFPLLQLRESGPRARAEGLLARGSWQGDPARAPANLAAWVQLREVFAAVPPAGGSFSAPAGAAKWSAVAQVSAGHLQHLEVSFPGERITLHFSR